MSALVPSPNGNGSTPNRHEAAEYLANIVTPLVAERLGEQVQHLEVQVARLEALVGQLLDGLANTDEAASSLVDTGTLAKILGVEPEWVRTHAIELGALRLGNGPRPRLRFDVEAAKAAMRRRA